MDFVSECQRQQWCRVVCFSFSWFVNRSFRTTVVNMFTSTDSAHTVYIVTHIDRLFPVITHDQHRTYNQNHSRLQTMIEHFQYFDEILLPASNPSGYPKIISERYNYSTGHITFAMIDALATFLYSLQYDILRKFMDVEAHPRVKVLRFNRDIGGNDIYVERDRRCISVYPTTASPTQGMNYADHYRSAGPPNTVAPSMTASILTSSSASPETDPGSSSISTTPST